MLSRIWKKKGCTGKESWGRSVKENMWAFRYSGKNVTCDMYLAGVELFVELFRLPLGQ